MGDWLVLLGVIVYVATSVCIQVGLMRLARKVD